MNAVGIFGAAGAPSSRRFRIGASIVIDQIVCHDETAAQIGEILDPATVNDYSEGLGVALEAGTYTTTQGTGTASADVLVRCTYAPNQLIKARCSGGVTVNTALDGALNGNVLTNTSASAGGTVVSDTDVGTSEFVGGYLYGLTGQNAGQRRVITSHSDNTSTTVTVPFDYAIAVNDTLLRTFGILDQGHELTTDYTQFNMVPGAAVDLPDTGHSVIWEVEIDTNNQGTATTPLVFATFVEGVRVPYAELAMTSPSLPKPEGFGTEIADAVIRLQDVDTVTGPSGRQEGFISGRFIGELHRDGVLHFEVHHVVEGERGAGRLYGGLVLLGLR